MSSSNLPLTKEQEDLLRELEEEFKDRYTDNDPEFMSVFNETPSEPPILENWFEPRFRNRFRGDNYSRQDHNDRHHYRHSSYEGDRRDYYNDRRHRYHEGDRYGHSSRRYQPF